MSRIIGLDLPAMPHEQVARDRRLVAQMRARARRTVAAHAVDADDLRHLLSVLDLHLDERDHPTTTGETTR